MQIPKQIKLRTFVFLLACMLVVSSISVYYGLSASTPTSGITDIYIEPPLMESSYIIGIYTAPSTCYLKNGTSGQITTTGTFAVCLNTALYAMTTGGKIFIRAGRYNLTAGMSIIYSGTYIEGECLGGVGEPAVQIDAGITGVTNQLITYTAVPTYYHAFMGGIKNVAFIGQSTANSIAVAIEGFWSDLMFEGCGFAYFDHGVKLTPILPGTDKLWNIWFDNCLFEENLRYGIYLTQTSSGTDMIDRVRISNSHFFNNQNSIFCDTEFVYHITFTDNTVQSERQACINTTSGGRQWIITDNHIFDCGIGANGTMAAIMVNGTATFYPDSWLIENNIIANHFTSAPVAMNNSIWLTGTVTNFVIQGNFFFQASEPIRIDGLTSYSSIMVNGNDDYAKNLVFPTEVRAYSYIIGAFKSTYFMLNCSTGYVDYQSTNAALVHQYAFANTSNAGGGTVFTTAGTYVWNQRVFIYSNVTWIGEGYGTFIQQNYNGSNYEGIVANAHSGTSTIDEHIRVSNIRFDGALNYQTNQAPSILEFIGACQNILIDHNWFYNVKGFVILQQATSTANPSFNIELSDNYCLNSHYNLCGLGTDGSGALLRDARILRNYVEYTDTALTVGGNTQDFQMIGNHVFNGTISWSVGGFNNSVALATEPYGGYVPQHGIIADNTIEYCKVPIGITGNDILIEGNMMNNSYYIDGIAGSHNGFGIVIASGSNNSIIGNSIYDCSYNGAIYLNGACTNTFVSGNYMRSYSGIAAQAIGIWAVNAINSTITNNYIEQMYATGSTWGMLLSVGPNYVYDNFVQFSGIGIEVASNDNEIISNRIKKCGTGITLGSGKTGLTIERNIISECTTNLSNSATNPFVRWNQGYKTEASGALASCVNGTAIPHGMVTTPAVLTLCLHGPTAYNATMILCAPTILSGNATHMVIEFVMWETVTWTLVPVTAVEAQTVWWTAQTWNYP